MLKAILTKAHSAMCDYCDRRRMCKQYSFGETLRKFICNKCTKVLEEGKDV